MIPAETGESILPEPRARRTGRRPAAAVITSRQYHSPLACMHHYLHMARGSYREHVRGEVVWRKKYFYVLRPVLACRWIERGLGPVPTEFGALLGRVVEDESLRAAIDDLLERKRAGEELDRGPRIPAISDFPAAEIDRLAAGQQALPARLDSEPLDRLLLETMIGTWGDRLDPEVRP